MYKGALERWKLIDKMNAKQCCIAAKAGHLAIGDEKREPEERDFYTINHGPKQENPLPEMGDTPEMIQRKLEMLTISMGGGAMPRGV